jgi:hypothetical protein
MTSLFAMSSLSALGKEITTNAVEMTDAPDWLKTPRVEKVTDHIQNILEWSTHKINVHWYTTQAEFEKVHTFGPLVLAITKHDATTATMYIGPQVNEKNFDEVFGHELVHVIVFQKYKDSIPKWLEEGLANHFSRTEKVDYKWLAQQPFPDDVHNLAHPFNGSSSDILYRYRASQAFAEMLAKKCDLEVLIRLSITRKMEDFMKTYCEINDLNAAFRDWVKKKAAST